ncbi:MAG: branched-chain amino acid ABC transporter permease [Chloroflexi bacterium]|nr:branched-chain amino acid ABC transporter permease [Chloroflexota bacterium]
MSDPLLLVQVAASGLLLGAVYALFAGGLNLIFGVMRVINIAHGELLMLGAFSVFLLFDLLHIPFLIGLPIAAVVLFFVGAALYWAFVRHVVGAPELTSLLLTFGVSIILANLGLYLFSADYRSLPYLTGSVRIGPFALSEARLLAFSVALLLSGGTFAFLRFSRLGKAVRATAQQPQVAAVCGVDVDRIRLITFGLGSALAGVAGALLITIFSVNPEMGRLFILKAFAIIVLGGMGSFAGAFVAGLLLGLIESYVGLFGTVELAEGAAYVLLLLILLIRPTGLLGVRE